MPAIPNQVVYALRQALILAAIAAIGYLSNEAGNLITDPTYLAIAGIVLAGALRLLEGFRDANRAANGNVIPADVGYRELQAQESVNSALSHALFESQESASPIDRPFEV